MSSRNSTNVSDGCSWIASRLGADPGRKSQHRGISLFATFTLWNLVNDHFLVASFGQRTSCRRRVIVSNSRSMDVSDHFHRVRCTCTFCRCRRASCGSTTLSTPEISQPPIKNGLWASRHRVVTLKNVVTPTCFFMNISCAPKQRMVRCRHHSSLTKSELQCVTTGFHARRHPCFIVVVECGISIRVIRHLVTNVNHVETTQHASPNHVQ